MGQLAGTAIGGPPLLDERQDLRCVRRAQPMQRHPAGPAILNSAPSAQPAPPAPHPVIAGAEQRARPTVRSATGHSSVDQLEDLFLHRAGHPSAQRTAQALWVPETRPWSLTCRDAGRC